MDKTILRLQKTLFFWYLAFFPFGQAFKFAGLLHPTDILVTGLLIISIWRNQIPKQLWYLVAIMSFSYIYGSVVLDTYDLVSVLYLIRLIAYINFGLVLIQLIKAKILNRDTLYKSLVLVLTITALFGWIQYLIFPDLRQLYWLGWDDHYGRMVGTFLDPGFLGILLVAGFLLVKRLPLKLFFLISVLFTYSRASYLALAISMLFLLIKRKQKLFLVLFSLLGIGIIFLPQGFGEGMNLMRTKSIELRLENYNLGFDIISKSPLLGVGFNNVCIAKEIYLDTRVGGEHGCSGFDNSFIFLWATTGIVGVIAFFDKATKLFFVKNETLLALLIAIGVHGLFHNTLFYPWVMGLMVMAYTLLSHPSQSDSQLDQLT